MSGCVRVKVSVFVDARATMMVMVVRSMFAGKGQDARVAHATRIPTGAAPLPSCRPHTFRIPIFCGVCASLRVPVRVCEGVCVSGCVRVKVSVFVDARATMMVMVVRSMFAGKGRWHMQHDNIPLGYRYPTTSLPLEIPTIESEPMKSCLWVSEWMNVHDHNNNKLR